MLSRAWSFLAKDKNRVVLGFVGSAAVVVVGAGWAAFTFLHGGSAPACGPITATNGGVAVGGNVDGTINVGPNADQVRQAIASDIEAFCKVRMVDLRLGGDRSSPWMSGEKTAQTETGATSATTVARNDSVTVGPDHLGIVTPPSTALTLNGGGTLGANPLASVTPLPTLAFNGDGLFHANQVTAFTPPSTVLTFNGSGTLGANPLASATPLTTLALNGDGLFHANQITALTPPSTALALDPLAGLSPASTTLAFNGSGTLGANPLASATPSAMVNFAALPTGLSALSSLANDGLFRFNPANGEITRSPQ
jgi:hypothetical protein